MALIRVDNLVKSVSAIPYTVAEDVEQFIVDEGIFTTDNRGIRMISFADTKMVIDHFSSHPAPTRVVFNSLVGE